MLSFGLIQVSDRPDTFVYMLRDIEVSKTAFEVAAAFIQFCGFAFYVFVALNAFVFSSV